MRVGAAGMTRLLELLVPASALRVRAFLCMGDLRRLAEQAPNEPFTLTEWDHVSRRCWVRA